MDWARSMNTNSRASGKSASFGSTAPYNSNQNAQVRNNPMDKREKDSERDANTRKEKPHKTKNKDNSCKRQEAQQPTANEDILVINFKEEWKELINLSFTVIFFMEISRDSLAETFMFSFLEQEDILNMCWEDLKI